MKIKLQFLFFLILPVTMSAQVLQDSAIIPHPPIPIPFTLEEDGYVSLVIEDTSGIRIRNLISETWFPAGQDTAWWDGLDDLGRDIDAAEHGLYHVPGNFVDPSNYRVRGLVRGKITPKYQFSPYTTGNPPWLTEDHTGAWLANHSAPMAAVYLPADKSISGDEVVMLGCYVTEGPDGVAWVDLDGKKLGGKRWIGGHWTGAQYLVRDDGENDIPANFTYAGSVWETYKNSDTLEIRITALSTEDDQTIVNYELDPSESPDPTTYGDSWKADHFGGMAVHNGIVIASITINNKLLFVDAALGEVKGSASLNSPKGLAFDADGRLLALSGSALVRFSTIDDPENLPAPDTLISGLSEPIALTLDANGNFFISDRGDSHQVKIFSPEGTFLRAIGNPGKPEPGPYDPLHMNNPAGLTIDSREHLWVTEEDFLPKRVSVWTLNGELIKAFYGPGKYGGGGTLDGQDSTKFYYADEDKGSMEFEINWADGTDQLKRVIYRKTDESLELAFRTAAPELPLTYNGKRYFTNCYNTNPVRGHGTAFLFADRSGVAKPVVAMGTASDWDILKTTEFKALWPDGVDLNSNQTGKQAFFIWSDLNEDYDVQTDEVQFVKAYASGVTVMPDLSFCIARIDEKATQFFPISFTGQGTPVYDITKGKVIANNVQSPGSSGGNQLLVASDSISIITLGVSPFHRYSISGMKNGVPVWSYPNMWPGLHASHSSGKPEFPGELIGPTRLLGGFFEAADSAVGKIWALNGNHGNFYLFTADGLFVATVFEDMRVGSKLDTKDPYRDMVLEGITLQGENFWPTISQTNDGTVYLVDGRRSAVVHLDGIENIHIISEIPLTITSEDIEDCMDYFVEAEEIRQQSLEAKSMEIELHSLSPVVDGSFDDWQFPEWLEIDKSGEKAYFNSDTKPYDYTGSVTISGDRLYLAYRTADPDLLKNAGDMPIAPFITGGALDLMIGANPEADPDRRSPVEGDSRLVITRKNGNPWAMLYRAVVEGTQESEKVPFSSPWRTITFDKVEDVSDYIEFAESEGNYEVSVPLSLLGLNPQSGDTIKADIGILRGDGGETIARSYWSNKATGIVTDVPSEAILTPNLWGNFAFNELSELYIKVISRSTGDPIIRAQVTIDGKLYLTDSQGDIKYTDLTHFLGESYISAAHNDFFSVSDTLDFVADSTYRIFMSPKHATVEFIISDDNGLVSGAEVTMGNTLATNFSGQAVFYYQPARTEYQYSVEKTGYNAVKDSFFLDMDTTINLVLSTITGIERPGSADMKISPNPFDDHINIDIQESARLLLYDILGVLRYDRKLVSGRNTIATAELEKGIYIYKIIAGDRSFNDVIIK